MTGEVVALADHRPHLSGPARCMECGHRWVAVAPIGTTRMECTACTLNKGAWVGGVYPPDGTSIWTCSCGNDLFVLCEHGAPQCARCGVRAAGWAEGS